MPHNFSGLTDSQSAAYGAVLGAITGDAAGGVLEFLGHIPSAAEVQHAMAMPGGGVFDLAPGQFTDDGEMTAALLGVLSSSNDRYPDNGVAAAYGIWADSHPFDMGQATAGALLRLKTTNKAREARERALSENADSKANGSLMRATPLGIIAASLSEEASADIAARDSSLTHPNESCKFAVAAYVLAIRHLVHNPGDNQGAMMAARAYLESTQSEVTEWLDDAIQGYLPPARPLIGFVRIAFTHAFYHLGIGSSYDHAIRAVLSLGGDTDTNAAIVGGLVGAGIGVHGIPNQMLSPVLECDTALGQPRPEQFTIKRLLFNLERLVYRIN